MIALLFLLLVMATSLAWYGLSRSAYFIYFVTIIMGIYWLHFHATTELKVVL